MRASLPSPPSSCSMASNISMSAGSHGQAGETSSRCVTKKVTAAHNFEVPNFSLLDGMGIGKFVSSCAFSVGDCDWSIYLFPDGSKEEDKASYVSVFLFFRRGAAVVRTMFTFSVLDKHGKASELTEAGLTKLEHTFGSSGSHDTDWGLSKFIEKSRLQTFLRLNDDTLRIRCVLTVIKEPQSEAVVNTILVPPSNLHQDLAHMLKDGRGKDVTFSVEGQLFNAHRCVLSARSPVFEAELFGPLKKEPEHCIHIDDMEPAIFEALLHFVYTDTLPAPDNSSTTGDDDDNNVTMMQHLLVAADRYGLERLRLMCEAKLCDGIDVLTVATTLALAEQHNCVQLKDACLRYIASSGDALAAVMGTDGFKHLKASCPSITTEILDKIAAVASNRSISAAANLSERDEV